MNINPILLNILIRQVKAGNIDVEDIKDEAYKQAVKDRFKINEAQLRRGDKSWLHGTVLHNDIQRDTAHPLRLL